MRLGVDFGTSHTVAVLAYPDGRTKSMLFDDGTPLLRSAVYADSDGQIQVGRDAVRRAGLDPTRYEPNPKQRIDEQTVLLGDSEHRVPDLFAAVLKRVVSEVRRVAGTIPQDVVMTFPAAWGARRREILTGAAATAGLHNVRLIPEPVGAAVYFTTVLGHQVNDGRPLGVFDFGGGTLDVAVVRRDGNTFTVLSTGGLPDLGGVDLDSALVDHLGELIAQRDPALWRRLSNPEGSADRRSRQLLWDDVRGAKESLSRTTSAPVNVPETDTDLHLTRDEFERLTTPLLQRAINETQRVIREARCEPAQLAGLFLVGGSSRVPLVARMLHSGLGIPPTVLEQPEVAVAEGAAKLGAAKPNPGQSPSNSPMSNSPMSAPPSAPRSGPPAPQQSNQGYRSPSQHAHNPAPSNSPMSAPPVSGPPVSGAPSSPMMTPSPPPYRPQQQQQQHAPNAYTPPPQQQAYTPPPPRPPILPPVQRAPQPPPQPQIIQVPYAVPVHQQQQPVFVPRRNRKRGPIIALVIVALLGFCCYGTFIKPSVTSGIFGDFFTDLSDDGPVMNGSASVPSALSSFFEPWKKALNECWVSDSGEAWQGPESGGFTRALDKIGEEPARVYCSFDTDVEDEYKAGSILFVDSGGEDFEKDVASSFGLKDTFNGSGKSGTDEYSIPYVAIDGSYSYYPDVGVAIAGWGSDAKVTDLDKLFQEYSI
ncbi:Hsp70 family protein [Phytomonospora sp. NPDC050363]|uniref:Hsp70 family protein n=1 Tax=Phytomonospora sp. NPDC050363 TaxID=3155642 RepID=UPI003405C119